MTAYFQKRLDIFRVGTDENIHSAGILANDIAKSHNDLAIGKTFTSSFKSWMDTFHDDSSHKNEKKKKIQKNGCSIYGNKNK